MTPIQFPEKSLCNKNKECVLREPGDLPGVSIEAHQAKHTLGWPGGYGGAPGTCFPKYFGVQDTIALAQVLIKDTDLFKTPPPSNFTAKLFRFDIENCKKELEPDLYRKLQPVNKKSKTIETVCMNAAFNQSTYNWDIHFFPDSNPRRNNLKTS